MSATAELAIRARRAAFNRAIVDRDVSAIGPILARDCVMVTGTDSGVISGRMAQVKIWRREFAAPSPAVYTRMPDSVTASPVEPVALETGKWEGREGASDRITSSGVYTAKWRNISGEWVVEAEIFVTMA